MPDDSLLPANFFDRGAEAAAIDLLGKRLRRGPVELAITEVEAYLGPDDSASHARFGKTRRNAVMFGPSGRAYVYLCYGIHRMLNVVCRPEGEPSAILIRSAAPVAGRRVLAERRGGRTDAAAFAGPGKIGQALALELSDDGTNLLRPGDLELRDAPSVGRVARGPRVGIDYARPEDRDALLRFADAESEYVTHRRRFIDEIRVN